MKSDLISLNSQIILQQLRPCTSFYQAASLTYTASNDEAFQAALTSRNVTEVENLVWQVLEGESLDPAIVLQIKKLSKVATKAIVDITIQSSTNEELLTQLKHCKK